MRSILVVIMLFSLSVPAFAAEDGDAVAGGRYRIYEIRVDNVPTAALLDTQTGKTWVYRFDSNTGTTAFTGVTIQGIAYAKKNIDDIDTQLQEWYQEGMLDRDVKNFRDRILNEFSYAMDYSKAKKINDDMKSKVKNK